jgi:hypothetical protein
MKIKVLYNKHTKKYRIAYRSSSFKRWEFAQRNVFSSQVTTLSKSKFVDNMVEIAEFDVIGEVEEFIIKYIAPRDKWYDPRDDAWEVEAEVTIKEKVKYAIPTIGQ